jgi:predicted nucleic acid-binding protein
VAVLDTNVLLRYLTDDDPDHAERALRLLQRVEAGERSVLLTEGVLIEIVQVLASKRLYNLPREIINFA